MTCYSLPVCLLRPFRPHPDAVMTFSFRPCRCHRPWPCSAASASLRFMFGLTVEGRASSSSSSVNPARLRFDSAPPMRSSASLDLATSTVIGLPQLRVRPGHEMMESRLREDCADLDRLRPDRVRSKGSYQRTLRCGSVSFERCPIVWLL